MEQQYAVSVPYFTEGPREHTSWKGVPIVIQRRTLGTFVGQIIQSGLQVEAFVRHHSILWPRTKVTPIPHVGTLFLGQA